METVTTTAAAATAAKATAAAAGCDDDAAPPPNRGTPTGDPVVHDGAVCRPRRAGFDRRVGGR
jgi:hypothetical protein